MGVDLVGRETQLDGWVEDRLASVVFICWLMAPPQFEVNRLDVRRQLEAMFNVEEVPTVVVLRPDCSVLAPNAVEEILRLGPDCYRNWQEAAELIDRNFMMNEDFERKSMRSWSDPVRRLKYKVEDERKKKTKKERRGGEEAGGGGGGGVPF